jgi:hypothetical protein
MTMGYKVKLDNGQITGPKFSTFEAALKAACYYNMDRKNAGSHWPKAVDVVEVE